MNLQILAQNVRRLRTAKRLSQSALADDAGLSLPAIKSLELAKSEPRMRTMQAIAKALDVKLQELFGLIETPRIGDGRIPLTLHLLSPAGRPVQITNDLRSFWTNTYADVRKELRGRYPKHPWPEDPLSAVPTKKTKRHTG